MWRYWGLDGASGTLDPPLATMAGAQRGSDRFETAMGTLRSGFMTRCTPSLKQFVFGPEDSGSENEIIRYGAWDGASPTFHSLVEVEGWESHEGSLIKALCQKGSAPKIPLGCQRCLAASLCQPHVHDR